MAIEPMTVAVNPSENVTAVIYKAESSLAGVTLVLGHGAGANQTHPFMVTFSEGLAARGIDAVTFNFSYTEHHRKVPDRGDKLEACYRAVIAAVAEHPALRSNRLFIGGKSMGGRIASQVAAEGGEGLRGLVFLGYPLHPPGKLDQLRSKHLPKIKLPMLFLQGTRDSFGTPVELEPIIRNLTPIPDIYKIEGGDHSFKTPKKQGLSQDEVYTLALDAIAAWLK